MDYNDFLSMIEQYESNGGDMSNFKNHITTLAANGKTPLGLNQWQRSDKPVMDDFNEDNRVIDEQLRELIAHSEQADESLQKLRTGKADKDGALQSNLNADLLRGWKLFDNVTQLGLSDNNDLTMVQISEAMPDRSQLIHMKGLDTPHTHYPATAGTLLVIKWSIYRCPFDFATASGGSTYKKWLGNAANGVFTGWKEVAFV